MATTAMVTAGAQGASAQYFERIATYPVYMNLPEGADPGTETVAEIVTASADGMTLAYTDAETGAIGMVDISDPSAPVGLGMVSLDGEPTSATIVGGMVLAAVNTSESYTEPSGHLSVIDMATQRVTASCDLGGQPDSVAASPDGAFLAVAIENERDEDLDDGVIPQLPAGGLALFDLGEDGVPTNCDAVRMVDLSGLAGVAGTDPESEFVDINTDNLVVVTLQENNHLIFVDAVSGEVTGHFSAGAVDLEAIDTVEEGVIAGTGSLVGVVREPDAVAWLDDAHIVTANEGDYEGGSRGFTIFDKEGSVVYDSASLMEHLGMSHGHYPEHRAENKGVEPEGVDVGIYGSETHVFVNSERGNFVAVFTVDGDQVTYKQFLPTSVGPEGLLAIPERDLFVVATEVDSVDDKLRATLVVYSRTADRPFYPHIMSENAGGPAPIGWGALSGLAADPDDAQTLYAVSDSAYSVSTVYTIDVSGDPARITSAMPLMKDGEPANYDLEGIAPASGGGFWIVSEGNPEKDNPQQQKSTLLKVAADGAVEEEIFLPDAVYDQAERFGFEGVAAEGEGDAEKVLVVFQRAWKDDPKNHAKIGIYSPASGEWGFVHYPLEEPRSPRGGWVGLSEIVALGDDRYALIERDNQTGVDGVLKTLTVISLAGVTPGASGGELPVVEKSASIDIVDDMNATNGWIGDKPEGLTVAIDGRVYLVTDNDGVDDASGETQFFRLGMAQELFAE
jgi:hypothetical protein